MLELQAEVSWSEGVLQSHLAAAHHEVGVEKESALLSAGAEVTLPQTRVDHSFVSSENRNLLVAKHQGRA